MTATVRIKRVAGQWYAFGRGPKQSRNLLLVPAIRFCERLNEYQKGKHHDSRKNELA